MDSCDSCELFKFVIRLLTLSRDYIRVGFLTGVWAKNATKMSLKFKVRCKKNAPVQLKG